MSGFEFFFSFFGLILGLSVVEVITGLGRVLRRREAVRLGWVTPLLALFVLLDLASFWSVSWTRMQGVEPSYLLLLIGLAIAGIYYLAASLVFPDDLDAWPSLDDSMTGTNAGSSAASGPPRPCRTRRCWGWSAAWRPCGRIGCRPSF